MYKKKIVFISSFPRGGGVAITQLNLIKKNPNIFLWPYEFFYSNFYNEATALSKNINKINYFFVKNSFNKFFNFLKKKKNNSFDKKVFFKNLYNLKKPISKKNYLEHIIYCMIKASKLHNLNKITHVFILTTLRGLTWDEDLFSQNYLFITTNRKNFDSFKSIRNRTISSSGFDNFFSTNGKKSFFYWLESFQKLIKLKKKFLSKKEICCTFENLNYTKSRRNLIKKKNESLLKFELELNYPKKKLLDLNFLYEIFKRKITLNIDILPIEEYLFTKKNNNFFFFSYLVLKSLWGYKKVLVSQKKDRIFYKLIKFIYYFVKYHILTTKISHKYNNIIKANNRHLEHADYWNK